MAPVDERLRRKGPDGGRQESLGITVTRKEQIKGSECVRLRPPLPAIRNLRAGDGIWSMTRTLAPPLASTSAAMRPAGPAPMISTVKLMMRHCHGRQRRLDERMKMRRTLILAMLALMWTSPLLAKQTLPPQITQAIKSWQQCAAAAYKAERQVKADKDQAAEASFASLPAAIRDGGRACQRARSRAGRGARGPAQRQSRTQKANDRAVSAVIVVLVSLISRRNARSPKSWR